MGMKKNRVGNIHSCWTDRVLQEAPDHRFSRKTARRLVSPLLAVAAALGMLYGCGGIGDTARDVLGSAADAAAAQTAADKNVVVMILDDANFDIMEHMPNVQEEFVRGGQAYANNYIPHSICCPSRAAILTGKYNHNNGIEANNPGFDITKGAFDDKTIATEMEERGYRTALFGKYLNNYDVCAPGDVGTSNCRDGDDTGYIPPGWDRWVAKENPNSITNEFSDQGSYAKVPESASSDTAWFTDKMLNWMDADASTPEFIYYAPYQPHEASDVSPRFDGTFYGNSIDDMPRDGSFNESDVGDKPDFVANRKRFCTIRQIKDNPSACQQDNGKYVPIDDPGVEGGRHGGNDTTTSLEGQYERYIERAKTVDAQVGRVIKAYRDNGEIQNTYFVLVSDNGYLFGEHRLDKKRVMYEEASNTPLYVKGPGVPQGSTSRALVANIDIMQTALGIADGIPTGTVDPTLDGRNIGGTFLPAADPAHQNAEEFPRRFVLLERGPIDASVGYEEYYGVVSGAPDAAGRRWSYARYPEGKGGGPFDELYDIAPNADPDQKDNIAPGHPEAVGALKLRAEALLACSGASCRENDR